MEDKKYLQASLTKRFSIWCMIAVARDNDNKIWQPHAHDMFETRHPYEMGDPLQHRNYVWS